MTASVSIDGDVWYPFDQRRIPYGEPVHVGLVVCSAVHRDSCSATFEDVAVRRLSSE